MMFSPQQAHLSQRSSLLTCKSLCRIAQLTWLSVKRPKSGTIHPVTDCGNYARCVPLGEEESQEKMPAKRPRERRRSMVTCRRTVGTCDLIAEPILAFLGG